MEEELALILIFGLPIVAVITSHMRRMAELKLRMRETAVQANADEVEKLRSELQELRDTTTRFDLSFDTALQRLEDRVQRLEHQTQRSSDAQGTGAFVRPEGR